MKLAEFIDQMVTCFRMASYRGHVVVRIVGRDEQFQIAKIVMVDDQATIWLHPNERPNFMLKSAEELSGV